MFFPLFYNGMVYLLFDSLHFVQFFLHACNCFLLLFGYKLLVTEKWKTDYRI